MHKVQALTLDQHGGQLAVTAAGALPLPSLACRLLMRQAPSSAYMMIVTRDELSRCWCGLAE